MAELLTTEELEAITKLAYNGGKGDPQRDVRRRLLMHAQAAEPMVAFFLAHRDFMDCPADDPYLEQKAVHRRDAYRRACEAEDARERRDAMNRGIDP